MDSKVSLYVALPLIAVAVILMTYLGLFSSNLVIAVIVVLFFVVSYRNKRKFARQEKEGSRSSK